MKSKSCEKATSITALTIMLHKLQELCRSKHNTISNNLTARFFFKFSSFRLRSVNLIQNLEYTVKMWANTNNPERSQPFIFKLPWKQVVPNSQQKAVCLPLKSVKLKDTYVKTNYQQLHNKIFISTRQNSISISNNGSSAQNSIL